MGSVAPHTTTNGCKTKKGMKKSFLVLAHVPQCEIFRKSLETLEYCSKQFLEEAFDEGRLEKSQENESLVERIFLEPNIDPRAKVYFYRTLSFDLLEKIWLILFERNTAADVILFILSIIPFRYSWFVKFSNWYACV